jgi:hypothetical protein
MTWYCQAEYGTGLMVGPSRSDIVQHKWTAAMDENPYECAKDGKVLGKLTCPRGQSPFNLEPARLAACFHQFNGKDPDLSSLLAPACVGR